MDSVRFGLHGYTVTLLPDCLRHLDRCTHQGPGDAENGGLLFATFDGPGDAPERVATEFLVHWADPIATERQYAGCSIDGKDLVRDRWHQGHHWIGDWHTHDEPEPQISPLDRRTFLYTARESKHPYPFLVFIIRGTAPLPNGLAAFMVTPEAVEPMPRIGSAR